MTKPDLTPDLLLRAYAAGIFPMADHRDDPNLFWVDPPMRGVLPLTGFHISRSLRRRMNYGGYDVDINRNFNLVIDACADRVDTWINATIRQLYAALHQIGHAHSLEIRHDGRLTGGVYGVSLGGAFFGESMFSRRTDASKLALAHLTDHLNRCGFSLFDTQFLTPHLASLGAVEIPRAEYRAQLARAIRRPVSILDIPLETDPQPVIQRNTQTS